MPYIRKLPSGKYQATIRLANGKRATKTDSLKKVVRDWANEEEAKIRRGETRDPNAGKITLADWHTDWLGRRGVERTTADKDTARWRTHVEPRWGQHPLDSITRDDLEIWVRDMADRTCRKCRRLNPPADKSGMLLAHKRPDGTVCPGGQATDEDERIPVGLGRWTIQGVVHLLSAMLADATEKRRISANPAAGLRLPPAFPKPPFFWTQDEARQLLMILPDPWRTLVDLDMHVGLRWGELAGLKCQAVDTTQQTIRVRGVLTRRGWREYPKSLKSCRDVPIPPHLQDDVWRIVADRASGDLVFTAPKGGPLDDGNFRDRVFAPALDASGVRRGTPHDMRHTAASWLVMAGVDLYRVQNLLGHEKSTTTERYAHLAPSAHKAIVDAWASNPVDLRDAPVTHEGNSVSSG